MSDVELVIKIPEVFYEALKNTDEMVSGQRSGKTLMSVIYNAVAKGIPLPKGHGDLKDANKLKHAFISWSMAIQGNFTDADIASIVCNSPTIIEADKAGSEDDK